MLGVPADASCLSNRCRRRRVPAGSASLRAMRVGPQSSRLIHFPAPSTAPFCAASTKPVFLR